MKFKLDENIGRRGLGYLEASGHDVMTVRDQGLGGAADEELFTICSAEGRVLITLDRDFGHVLRFPPERAPASSSWRSDRERHFKQFSRDCEISLPF